MKLVIIILVLLAITSCDEEPKFKIGQGISRRNIFYLDKSREHGFNCRTN